MDLRTVDPMLATNHPAFSREVWIFEFKYEGYRILATEGQLLTRNKVGPSSFSMGETLPARAPACTLQYIIVELCGPAT